MVSYAWDQTETLRAPLALPIGYRILFMSRRRASLIAAASLPGNAPSQTRSIKIGIASGVTRIQLFALPRLPGQPHQLHADRPCGALFHPAENQA